MASTNERVEKISRFNPALLADLRRVDKAKSDADFKFHVASVISELRQEPVTIKDLQNRYS